MQTRSVISLASVLDVSTTDHMSGILIEFKQVKVLVYGLDLDSIIEGFQFIRVLTSSKFQRIRQGSHRFRLCYVIRNCSWEFLEGLNVCEEDGMCFIFMFIQLSGVVLGVLTYL